MVFSFSSTPPGSNPGGLCEVTLGTLSLSLQPGTDDGRGAERRSVAWDVERGRVHEKLVFSSW
jgi:hypothetical protein